MISIAEDGGANNIRLVHECKAEKGEDMRAVRQRERGISMGKVVQGEMRCSLASLFWQTACWAIGLGDPNLATGP